MRVAFLLILLSLITFSACRSPSPQVIFEDKFDNVQPCWRHNQETWIVENGYLKYIPDGNTVYVRYWVPREKEMPLKYTIEARAYFPYGFDGNGGWALFGKMPDLRGGYSEQYDIGAGGIKLFNWCTSSKMGFVTVPLDPEWHQLRLDFSSDTIKYFLDDNLLSTMIGQSCKGNGFGVAAWRNNIWFDWIRVTAK